MIISKNIELKIEPPFDNDFIENELSQRGIEPLRWAVVYVGETSANIAVSYVNEN